MSDSTVQGSAAVPMLPVDDPLVVAIFHAFESYDDDAIQDQDGDYTRGLARLAAYTVRQAFMGDEWHG